MHYTIYRNTYAIHTFEPTGQQERELMVKDIVPVQFSSQIPVHLQIGDYIDVWGSRYELYEIPEVTKGSTMDYQYSCEFKALYYKLSKWKFNGYDSANQLTLKRVELMLTLDEFADLLVANANRNGSGWTKGEVIETEPMYLIFEGENILEVVSQLAANFKTEWWFDNKVLNFSKRGTSTGVKFEYGYDKGLRGGMQRTNVNATTVFSRLRVEGSTQNLPESYRFGQTRLQLPSPMTFIQGTKYGPDEIEADVVFDDIRPERIGTITSVGDIYTFTDTGMDFDLNVYLLPISAKVSFLTGNLAGQNFEILKGGYNHATKTFKIVKSELESLTLPNEDLHPEVGDTYYIFDIRLPEPYVTDAEARLLARGSEYFTENAAPKVTYILPPDHFYFTRQSLTLSLGDYYHVKDFDLLLNKDIRLTGYTRDLHEEFKYTAMIISDTPQGASFGRQMAEARELKKAIGVSKIKDIPRSRLNWRATNELATMINTIKAEMSLIIIDGGNYQTDIISTSSVTTFESTAGQIAHEQYTDYLNGIWDVPAFTGSLAATCLYFVYVKADRFENIAEMVLSQGKIGVEDDPDFYYFPFGQISSVFSGQRLFTSLRGYTRTVAGTISTGRIQSTDGLTYFDLDNGKLVSANAEITGKIVAESGEIGGFTIENNTLKSGNLTLDSVNQRILFTNSNTADKAFSAVGGAYNAVPGIGVAPAIFANQRAQSVAENTTLILSAKGSSLKNTALEIIEGGIRVNGKDAGTQYVAPGNWLRFENGLFVGIT